MPDPNVPENQTANQAETAASEPAPVESQVIPAVTPEPAPVTDPNAAPANPDEKGSEPDGTHKVVDELKTQRKRRQEAEKLASENAAKAEYYRGLAEGRQKAQDSPTAKPQADQAPVAPTLDNFSTYEEYEKAEKQYTQDAIDYGVRKALERQQAEVSHKQSVNQVSTVFNERCKKAEKEIPDFQEIMTNYKSAFHPDFVNAVVKSDAGPQLIYYLAKNPQEAKRLEQMTVADAIFEIGSMKEKVKQSLQSKTQTVTQAPPPIVPGNGSGVTTETDLADLPMDQYARKRQEQMFVKVGSRFVRR